MRSIPISQFASDEIGITIFDRGVPTDADAGVTLRIVRDDGAVEIIPVGTAATRVEKGLYNFEVTPTVTGVLGGYTVTWSYMLDGDPFTFETRFIVNEPSPYWDSLDATQRGIVEDIYFRVSNQFDSSLNGGGGGPYLWEMPQSKFGYETIARNLVTEAMTLINFGPPKDFNPPWSLGKVSSNPFPIGWYGLLQKAGFWALTKHLKVSYLEQPLAVGITTARLDRRDYFDRWMMVEQQEKAELDRMLHMLRRRYMYAMRARAMLVAGGLFPISYLDPARPRWPYVSVGRF